MIVEDVSVPLIDMSQPELVRLVEWNVHDGTHVVAGQVLFDLDVGGVIFPIESFFSGYLKILKHSGAECRLGDVIGRVLVDELSPSKFVIPIELNVDAVSKVDAARGRLSRREFLSAMMEKFLIQGGCE